MNSALGIDPDSTGFVCALVRGKNDRVVTKRFLVTAKSLSEFNQWAGAEEGLIVAIEGSHGQSRPIEEALRNARVEFYSFKPADVEKFRKAVLGQNKNNERDAESVARYALALESQGKLQQHRRLWFADSELQLLTREHKSLSREITAEVNRLWKILRDASPDLYLFLGGKLSDAGCGGNVLKNWGILTLLISIPDVGEWKHLSDRQLLEAMGGGNYKGRNEFIRGLESVMQCIPSLSPTIAFMIRASASKIEHYKREQIELIKMLNSISRKSLPIQSLRQLRGIGLITASTMVAEIIDIRRFSKEDSLASYGGLGMKEHSTGGAVRMVHTQSFNHRLKDAFMTAAGAVVFYNSESRIACYHRNHVDGGMRPMEARKRVARAIVRVVYRRLNEICKDDKCLARSIPNEGHDGLLSSSTKINKDFWV